MLKIYRNLSEKDVSGDAILEDEQRSQYRKTLYGIALMHCVLQERRKYVPFGWSTPYQFNLDDLLVSRSQALFLK
jgi:hypothetical protein